MKSNIKKEKQIDKFAALMIKTGGFSVIFCALAIIILISQVSFPLFYNSSYQEKEISKDIIKDRSCLNIDDYGENVFWFSIEDKNLKVKNLKKSSMFSIPLKAPSEKANRISEIKKIGANTHYVVWDDYSVSIEKLKFVPEFLENGERVFHPKLETLNSWENNNNNAQKIIASFSDEDNKMCVVEEILNENIPSLRFTVITSEENFSGDLEQSVNTFFISINSYIKDWKINKEGNKLIIISTNNELLEIRIDDESAQIKARKDLNSENIEATNISFNYGESSYLIGDKFGNISAWFYGDSKKGKQIFKFHDLPGLENEIIDIKHNYRDKSYLAQDHKGNLIYGYMTSEIELFKSPDSIQYANVSNKGNLIIALTKENQLKLWEIESEFPKVNINTLFTKTWYEDYPEADYVWQSSASSEDYEPKMSLIPLMFGSLKSTFYAILFAVPLSLLAAIYISQFSSPKIKSIIKPMIELMAAVPSVVVGLLAAIWFAPLIDSYIVPFFLTFILFPLVFLLFLFSWEYAKDKLWKGKITKGTEFIVLIPAFLIILLLVLYLGPIFESQFLEGNFQQWLFQKFGTQYTQRNSVVIAFALGFTVIPIIFTMSEDSLSNVPKSLTAASLALGANRWQTVSKVIIWSASPGILAGIMIGVGRAVGETMIVLMATGNTPILDPSVFNGMRTLSATIAVEIPEAPENGDLYRTLFFAAVILFVLTFSLNTCAEFIRHKLRKKYGSF